jgi:hypothetical protein
MRREQRSGSDGKHLPCPFEGLDGFLTIKGNKNDVGCRKKSGKKIQSAPPTPLPLLDLKSLLKKANMRDHFFNLFAPLLLNNKEARL